jgi:hypothetical protein
MANPNIVNVTSILGKTAILNVTTTPTNMIENAANSNTILKLNYLSVANIDGSVAADITISVFRSSVEYKIAHTIAVPADSTLMVLERPIYLEEGDSLRLTASANSDLQAVCSYEIIS